MVATALVLPGTQEFAYAQTSLSELSSSVVQANKDSRKPTKKESVERRTVTLIVKDSSIKYAIDEIARQASLQPLYNKGSAVFSRRISVKIEKVPVMSGLNEVIKGTGLTARISSDGESVLIRPASDTASPGKANAARGILTGQVIDSASGKGIPSVTVVIPGIQRATSTDDAGGFRLNDLPVGNHTISFRLIGYQTQTMNVDVLANATQPLVITLRQTSITLTDVVTTATGAQRRIEISNDVIKIDADKIMERAPVRDITDLLVAAQVPGMVVTPTSGEPGAPKRIRFNGVGSINQNNDPVIIVDGIWIKSDLSTNDIRRSFGNGSTSNTLSSRLDAIDPSSIQSIEIVRGPAAATLYGPEAANGVIKITTKRGAVGPARWDFTLSRDWSNPVGNIPLIYRGFGTNVSTGATENCSASSHFSGLCVQDSITALDYNNDLLNKEQMGFTNRFTAAVSGGSQQVMYRLSANIMDTRGVRRLQDVNALRMRTLNVPVESRYVNPSFKRDRGMSASMIMVPRSGFDVTLSMDASQSTSDENNITFASASALNPLPIDDTIRVFNMPSRLAIVKDRATSTRGLVNLSTNLSPVGWWSGNFTAGIDREVINEHNVNTDNLCASGGCQLSLTQRGSASRTSSVYTLRGQSTFLPTLGWASRFITIRPGITADLRRQTSSGNRIVHQSPAQVGNLDGAFGSVNDPISSALAGVGANVYIRLFDRISLDPALRKDFGSARQLKNSSKTYPRFGTSWLVSEESFFPLNRIVSLLRLRTAMGYAATQPSLGDLYGSFLGSRVLVNGVEVDRLSFTAPGNTELEPERNFEWEFGFDADLFNERANLSVTHSTKTNTNSIINRTTAPSAGGTQPRKENVAKIVNKLTTLQLSGMVIDSRDITIRVGANLSIHDNQIRRLGPGVSSFGNEDQRYVAKYPVGSIWVRPVLGYADRNGDGYLESREVVMGDTAEYVGTNMPRITAGYNLEAVFKRDFSFSAFLDQKGSYVQTRNGFINGAALWQSVRAYWDLNASIPDQLVSRVLPTSLNYNDYNSISELRLHSASFTWNVPPSLVSTLKGRSVQVSLQGNNLYVWSQYRGRDPGVNASPIGEKTTDNMLIIPEPRSFSLQFRVGY